MNTLGKIRKVLRYLINFPWIIYFNFRYLPLRQAIKLPVFLCSPCISGKGKYIIEGKVKTNMIQLGFPLVSIFKETGIILENKGTVIFKGKTQIGANAALSIGEYGHLTFGEDFKNTYGMKLICYNEVEIGHTARFGWETFICDTDFHSLKSVDGNRHAKGFGKIKFGDGIWVGSFSKFYKNTDIPSLCTIAANTLINKKIECEPYSLIYSGAGIKIKHTGFYRDIKDDVINYSRK